MDGKKVFNNFLWRFFERCGSQGVSFIVSIVLARLLAPEEYGTIALVTVFITILQVFVNSGFGTALIQKKDADNVDFSTIFFFNIFVSVVLYVGMFFVAPLISAFYERPDLIPIIRVLSLILILQATKNVQQAYVSRNMMFKKFFFATLLGTILGAVVGIVLAWLGYGVWALVGQQLTLALIDSVVLWFTVKWRPSFAFSFSKLKVLYSFGWKMLVSSLLYTLYNDLRTLIIGKMYTSSDLAFYNKGNTFPNFIVSNINTSIDSVLLPAMSREQDNVQAVKSMTRRAIKTSTYLIMPLLVGLGVCAEPIISLLLTDKWLPVVPFMRIFCFTYCFHPIHTANLNAIKALGRSDLFLKLEIWKKIVGLVCLLSTMWFGVMAMAYSLLASTFATQMINAWPNKKLLNYGYFEQFKDISENMILSVIMGAIVYCVSFLNLSNILTLVIQVLLGVIIYILGSILLKLESFEYVLGILKSFIKKKANN